MKLNELYDNYIIDKAGEEVSSEFRLFTKKVIQKIKDNPKITKKQMKKLARQTPLSYRNLGNIIDTSLIMSPIVNYLGLSKQERKSKATQNIRKQVGLLTRNLGVSLKKPQEVVNKAYSIVVDRNTNVEASSALHRDFDSFLNSVDPQRKDLLSSTSEKMKKYSKLYKENFTQEIFENYNDMIKGGLSRQDAVMQTLNKRDFKNRDEVKYFLETQAHETYENAKNIVAKEQGLKYKYWRTQRDSRVRRSHQLLDGKIIKQDEKFKVGSSFASIPGDSDLPIGERINCRCGLEYSFVPRGSRKGYEINEGNKYEPPSSIPSILSTNNPDEFRTGKRKIPNGYFTDGYSIYDRKNPEKEIVNVKNFDINKIKRLPINYIKETGEVERYNSIRQEIQDIRLKIGKEKNPINQKKLRKEFQLKREELNKVDYKTEVVDETGWVYEYIQEGKYVPGLDPIIPDEWVQAKYEERRAQNPWKKSYTGNPNLIFEKIDKYYKEGMKPTDFQSEIQEDFLNIIEEQNFDKPPKIISIDELRNKNNKGHILVRGTTSKRYRETTLKYREDFLSGDFFLNNIGGAAYGRGLYTAISYDGVDGNPEDGSFFSLYKSASNTAIRYGAGLAGQREKQGIVDIMHIPKNAKTINEIDVFELKDKTARDYAGLKRKDYVEYDNNAGTIRDIIFNKAEIDDVDVYGESYLSEFERENLEEETKRLEKRIIESVGEEKYKEFTRVYEVEETFKRIDNGVFAAAAGYDAIKVRRRNYLVVLNRSKLEVVDDEKVNPGKTIKMGSLMTALEYIAKETDDIGWVNR